MNYRKFWLINGDGEKYDLTNIEESAFASDPQGLGAQATIEGERIGNSLRASSYKYEFVDKSFTLYFANTRDNSKAYAEYMNFFNFVNRLPLYLYYQTPNMFNESYSCEVLLNTIEKTEITRDEGTLICNVTFSPLTLWRQSEFNRIVVGIEDTSESKKYQLVRPYTYPTQGYKNVVINNTGATMIPFTIHIVGECTNPRFELSDSDGNIYGHCGFIGIFDEIIVNSSDSQEVIHLSYEGTTFINPMNYVDFSLMGGTSYFIFCYLKTGENHLNFDFDVPFNGTIEILWGLEYATI